MCRYKISIDDSMVNLIRPAFKDDKAINEWMQQQVNCMVQQLAYDISHSKFSDEEKNFIHLVVNKSEDDIANGHIYSNEDIKQFLDDYRYENNMD